MFIITKAVQFLWWMVHPVKSSIMLLNVNQNYDKIEQHVINFVPFGEVKTEAAPTASVINNINLYGTYVADKENSMAFVNINSTAYILQIGDEVQGYTIKNINPTSVELYDNQAKQDAIVNLSANKNASENTNTSSSSNYNSNNSISNTVNQFVSSRDSSPEEESSNTASSEPKVSGIIVHKRRS